MLQQALTVFIFKLHNGVNGIAWAGVIQSDNSVVLPHDHTYSHPTVRKPTNWWGRGGGVQIISYSSQKRINLNATMVIFRNIHVFFVYIKLNNHVSFALFLLHIYFTRSTFFERFVHGVGSFGTALGNGLLLLRHLTSVTQLLTGQ